MKPLTFRRLMSDLRQRGWKGVTLKSWRGGAREFVIAFDDGYDCVREYAWPILQELGFSATIFIPTGYLGRWNDWDHQLFGSRFRHLDADAIRELAEDGWEIGSHTHIHCSLTNLPSADLQKELVRSKSILEKITSEPVISLSVPFGRHNYLVLDAAKAAGYQHIVTPALIESQRMGSIPAVHEADAVYLWDGFRSLEGRLLRSGAWYRAGRMTRRAVNRASAGTIIWRRLFPARMQLTE